MFASVRVLAGVVVDWRPLLTAVALAGFVIAMGQWMRVRLFGGAWSGMNGWSPLLVLLALSAVGYLVGHHVVPLIGTSLIGGGATVLVLSYLRRGGARPQTISVYEFGAMLALAAASGAILYGSGYASPLFFELLSRPELGIHDTLYHAAVGEMLLRQGMPSVGADGVQLLRYHWGSHWLYAGLSRLVGISVLDGYQLFPPIVGGALLVRAVTALTEALIERWGIALRRNDLVPVLLVLTVAATGFVHPAVALSMGVSEQRIVSESLVLAVVLLLETAVMLVAISRAENAQRVWWAVAPLCVAIISVTKISVGAVLLALIGWLALRWRPRADVVRWGAVVASAMAWAAAVWITVPVGEVSGAAPRDWSVVRAIAASLVSWRVLVIASWSLTAMALLSRRSDRPLQEAVGMLCVCSVVPMWLLNTPDTVYFTEVQRWGTVPVIGAALATWTPRLSLGGLARHARQPRHLLVVGMLVSMSAAAAFAAMRPAKQLMTAIAATKHGSPEAEKDARSALITALRALHARDNPHARLVVADDLWELWAGSPALPCFAVPFLFSGVSGQVLANGLPSKDCRNLGFGLTGYADSQRVAVRDLPNEGICGLTRRAGGTDALILERGAGGVIRVRELPCRGTNSAPTSQ
ncbi:MAG: hypothetical protein IT353_16710 [Gemmatimonadaceae bacterium]|nr:hypothetical protein [Gemmatimonadaceae bacterium]